MTPARRSPVVPEALAVLLPDDFVAQPLAAAAPVLEAARTAGFGSLVSAPFEMPEETWLVQVNAPGCDWSVDLAPVPLGSDPNATPVPKVPAPELFGSDWNRDMTQNTAWLTALQARQALLGVGLEPGGCIEGMTDRVAAERSSNQDPRPGVAALRPRRSSRR